MIEDNCSRRAIYFPKTPSPQGENRKCLNLIERNGNLGKRKKDEARKREENVKKIKEKGKKS